MISCIKILLQKLGHLQDGGISVIFNMMDCINLCTRIQTISISTTNTSKSQPYRDSDYRI